MLLFTSLILSLFFTPIHPFHVSVCEINFKEETGSIQVSQRVFIDDLEQALNERFSTNLVIDDESTGILRDSLIQIYILENITILIDGKEKNRTYIGNEIEDDALWSYIEYTGIQKLDTLDIRNTILLDIFDDQANIIHFTAGDYEKSIKLDKLRTSSIITVSD